jgi:hypothetical protein
MSMNILNDISAVYLNQIVEKKESEKKESEEKESRWWDDDGDGKGWEEDEVSGKFPKKKKSKKSVKEGFSNWREDLREIVDEIETNKKIKEKKVTNKVTINPSFKESIENLGGELIEMVEIDERTLTSGEEKKREEYVKGMKKSGDFEKRYPGRGKEVMYATATKMAKEETEVLDERRREDKGTPRPERLGKAYETIKKMIRNQEGTPPGQRKKKRGEKTPNLGRTPEQKVALRRAQTQRSREWQQDTKGT